MKRRITLPIGAKIIGLLGTLLLLTSAVLVWSSTKLFIENNTALINQMTSETATQVGLRLRNTILSYSDRLRLLGEFSLRLEKSPQDKTALFSSFFEKNKDILAVVLLENSIDEQMKFKEGLVSPELKQLGDPTGAKAFSVLASEASFSLKRLGAGDEQISRISLGGGHEVFAIGLPCFESIQDKRKYYVVGFISENSISNTFRHGEAVLTYLVDSSGATLAHPDEEVVRNKAQTRDLEIVKKFIEGKHQNYQLKFQHPRTQDRRLAAFQAVLFGGLGVVAEVSEEVALEIVNRVRYRAILVGTAAFSIAFLLSYFFANSLTGPIRQLVSATQRVASGDFGVKLEVRGRDEITHLSSAFNEMALGLEERDRVKSIFHRFHNKEIANEILSGRLKLGGERKEAVILFTDLRDFTSISSGLSPEKVVEMINEYLSVMVSVIAKNHGVVDKFVGDAIMALWGVPLTKGGEVEASVKACIEMREALAKLNENRQKRGEVALRMGMGLHVGEVIVGNIGSEERMEYTAIGDSVNTASRIQTATKTSGVDLLVSEEVYSRVHSKFNFDGKMEYELKGKSKPMTLYSLSQSSPRVVGKKAA